MVASELDLRQTTSERALVVAGQYWRTRAALLDQAILQESEARLRESEARFSTAFQASPVITTIARLKDARFVEVNEAFLKLNGNMSGKPIILPLRHVINLGGTRLELHYVGRNHSDNSLVMLLPKEKIIFTVDTVPVGSVMGRGMIDSYPIEWEQFLGQLYTMDWERMIPGHPGQPGGRLGTKKDVQDQLAFLQDASEAVKVAAREGKCWDRVEKEMKLPKYESWPGYANNLQFVLRRYCGLWGRGT